MPPASSKRPQPPVTVPQASKPGGMPSTKNRELQGTLKDLGYYKGKINGYYNNELRNAVSLLQQRLIKDGFYDGAPNGNFDAATRAALLAHPDIPTV